MSKPSRKGELLFEAVQLPKNWLGLRASQDDVYLDGTPGGRWYYNSTPRYRSGRAIGKGWWVNLQMSQSTRRFPVEGEGPWERWEAEASMWHNSGYGVPLILGFGWSDDSATAMTQAIQSMWNKAALLRETCRGKVEVVEIVSEEDTGSENPFWCVKSCKIPSYLWGPTSFGDKAEARKKLEAKIALYRKLPRGPVTETDVKKVFG